MKTPWAAWLVCIATCLFPQALWAGGSGYNVVIVVNQNSTNSIQLGNYFRAQRNVPPQNYLRINWPPGSNVNWSLSDYTNTLLNPLLAMLSSRQLTNQIDYVVLSMDIPYRIDGDNTGNNESGTTGSLFYGFKADSTPQCSIAPGSSNRYAGSECIFRLTPPTSPSSNSWLVTMLTGVNLAQAEQVVSQGVLGDSTFPTNTVWLGRSAQSDYSIRLVEFDNTVFNTRLHGNYPVIRTNTDNPAFADPALGYENGSYGFSLGATFVPGSMADNLASFSGEIFESSGETTLLPFLFAGVAGSYGTVTEPCSYLEKFPSSLNYFYQARGFSLAECYYQSITNPYQGLVVGEPLSAPFAKPATGSWMGLASNTVLAATTNLSVQFTASDVLHPVQQLDVFLDGYWLQTVANIAPQQSNVLSVTLNGFTTNSTVPTNATIKIVTSNLVTALNNATYQGHTQVLAVDHGDRIELQSIAPYTTTGPQISLSVTNTNPTGPLTTFIHSTGTNFLDTIAWGYTTYQISGTPTTSSTLHIVVTKTNMVTVTLAVTNTANSNLNDFTQQFLNLINTNASLQGSDGLVGEDLQNGGAVVQFHLRANSTGYAAAQMSANITSIGLVPNPSGVDFLNDNYTDLEPRAHLYITAGTSTLSSIFPFVTTNLPDGYHELAAVAYEGSHVHTQARATQSIVIKNTPLSASFSAVLSGTNSALQPTLTFSVTPNTTNIATIQFFSTGGLLAAVTNQSSATFSIAYTNLGIGVHPFYALVADNSGHQYRTPIQSIGLIGIAYSGSTLFGVDYPFTLQVSGPAPILVWPATAGRTYNILSTTNLLSPFSIETTVTPTNSLGQFTETNALAAQQFYRVSVTP